MTLDRRRFNAGVIGAVAAAAVVAASNARGEACSYTGPNVIVVRFGGGVRRAEILSESASYAPFFRKVLATQGVLLPNVSIAQIKGVDTSHAEGTLNLLTGRYAGYVKVGARGLAPLLEPQQPTLFELLRREFGVPAHEALLVNGEDRPQEEYLTHGGHAHYGVAYRSEVIGLYRFKLFALARFIAEARAGEPGLDAAVAELARLRAMDYRGTAKAPSTEIERFWSGWRAHYGDRGLSSPRGDRLLTELALRAMKELRPKLMMINYQDPDYVHWGNASHYTRAIGVIDQGLAQLTAAIGADAYYRDRTVLVVVPDCGRDANPLLAVPFQHHFNSRSAHEIFALIVGPGIVQGRVLDKPVDQTSIAATVGALMGLRVEAAEGRVLSEVFA